MAMSRTYASYHRGLRSTVWWISYLQSEKEIRRHPQALRMETDMETAPLSLEDPFRLRWVGLVTATDLHCLAMFGNRSDGPRRRPMEEERAGSLLPGIRLNAVMAMIRPREARRLVCAHRH